MANYYTNLAFSFTAPPSQAANLEALVGLDFDVDDTEVPEFLAGQFTDMEALAHAIFSDPDYPFFSADFDVEADGTVRVTAWEAPDVDAIAKAIQLTCSRALPVGFQWANSCDKHRDDAFSGGWCAIHADQIIYGSTHQELQKALAT